jgi:chromosome segregation ATPase
MYSDLIYAVAPAAGAGGIAFDLNTVVSGGVGAAVVSAIIYVIKLILDRTIPSRSDARANVGMVLEGLNNMVKVLQEEKVADAVRLAAKTDRIEVLEQAADKDYDRISELRAEIIDLRNRLATKDRHINTLVSELRKLGAQVTGLELGHFENLEVTHTTEEVRKMRADTGEHDLTPEGR